MGRFNKSRFMILIFVCILSLLAISSSVQALMLEFSFEELVDGADAIVIGQVETTTSYWNEEKTNIYTINKIKIKETLKGTYGNLTITVITEGGTVGDIWQWVEHEPVFTVGETVGLFLTKLPSATSPDKKLDQMPQLSLAGAYYSIYALEQGMIPIVEEKVASTTGLPEEFFTEDVNLVLEGKPVVERSIELQSNQLEKSGSSADPLEAVDIKDAPSLVIDPEYDDRDVEINESDDHEIADTEGNEPGIDEITFNQTITSISPNVASAGTNTEVTVSGSGFGTRGEGDQLAFYFKTSHNGSDLLLSSIITSWSDTQIRAIVPVIPYDPYKYPYSACSGPVYIYKDGSYSIPAAFTVTFGYMGVRWQGTNPTVTYRVNDGGVTARRTAVQNAANSWNNAGSNFSFNYGGATTISSFGEDGVNVVIWTALPDGILGRASIISSGGFIIDTDFAFNTSYTWSTTPNCPSDAYDVESVGVHEFGHWLSLRDLYGNRAGYPQDTEKIMYGRSSSGAVKRNLHAHDILGIQWIYGASATNYTLTVNSTNPTTGVVITSTTGHGGTTYYNLTLAAGTSVDLTAPEYHGSGIERERFDSWSGSVNSPNHTISTIMNSNRTVTANYVYDPDVYTLTVNSTNPTTGVVITSSTGHGGSTAYTRFGLDSGTGVALTAPHYHGSGASRKRFDSWSGSVNSPNHTIITAMNSNRTVTANYVDDPEPGSIQVNIEPEGARTAGAQWRLTSGPDTAWKDSGETITGLTSGTYTIQFRSVTGWRKPKNITVTLGAGENAVRMGTYTMSAEPTWTNTTALTAHTLAYDGGVLAASFDGVGTGIYHNGSWDLLTPFVAKALATDGNILVASFEGSGVWRYDGSWEQLTTATAQLLAVDNGNVVASFDDFGIWYYDGEWVVLTSATARALAYKNNVLVASVDGFGTWLSDGTWRQITTETAQVLALSGNELVASFDGHGIWHYGGIWQQLTPATARALAIDNGALAASVDSFGTWLNDDEWQQLTAVTAKHLGLDGGTLAAVFESFGVWLYE